MLLVAVIGVGLYTNSNIGAPNTAVMSASFADDFSDNRILMGASHNVFVGKVIKKVGNENRGIGPRTQVEVSVAYNIKGDLRGTVIVDQLGGYRDGVLYAVRGGDVLAPSTGDDEGVGLLQPGSSYLFVTRYFEEKGWYTINFHPNATKLMTGDSTLSALELEELAQNDEKVKTLEEAYKTEILAERDIRNDTTRNSYESLQRGQ